jgi:hypothetical protein
MSAGGRGKIGLNLFPARVAIGALQADGSVLPSPEFVRAMSALFDRVGGALGMGSDDLALLASSVEQPDQVARRAAADALLAPAIDQGALLAVLAGKLASLQVQVSQFEGIQAEVAKLRGKLAGAELLAGHRDPYRVNWERPGRIGFFKAGTGAFTALTANTVNKLTLTAPATGATLTLADGATLVVPAPGGTLGSAAYQSTSAFAARTSTSLAPVATDPATTQALANSLRAALISVGIGT